MPATPISALMPASSPSKTMAPTVFDCHCGTGKKRLTTSAIIASIASEGQDTRSAPFGHALAALADQRQDIVGMSAYLSKYTDLHIFAILPGLITGYGPSHQATDDLAIFRAKPNLMIIDPCDALGSCKEYPPLCCSPRPGLHTSTALQCAAGAGRVRQ